MPGLISLASIPSVLDTTKALSLISSISSAVFCNAMPKNRMRAYSLCLVECRGCLAQKK